MPFCFWKSPDPPALDLELARRAKSFPVKTGVGAALMGAAAARRVKAEKKSIIKELDRN